MPVETALWRIAPNGLIETRRVGLKSEADLHRWIEADARLLGGDLLIIGSEVVTDFNGRIDLLALDPAGTVHIIELKRDKTPREVVAQALDYASWVAPLDAEDLQEIYRRYKGADLGEAYQERFGTALPETLNDEHRLTIVASALDASSERIVQYLSEYHDVAINAVFFTVFDDGNGQVLTRSWLLDPEQVTTRAEDRSVGRKERGEWTGFWFVNVGVTKDEDRTWDDALEFRFVSGGQGARYRDYLKKLKVGDRIFAYIIGRGYVGYGVVEREAVMARDFRLADGTPLFAADVKGTTLRENPDDEERAEYIVAVQWKKTVPASDARKYPGIFAIQQIVCKIYDAKTTEFLMKQFDVAEPASA
jgi:hypothetical protein